VTGVPFIGENGFYPRWATGNGRWVFQRTFWDIGPKVDGYAEAVMWRIPSADQVVVWAPRRGAVFCHFLPAAIHSERQDALRKLSCFSLRCYGQDCNLEFGRRGHAQCFVVEAGLRPQRWRLQCPICAGRIGPDLAPVAAEPLVKRWREVGCPVLDAPIASPLLRPKNRSGGGFIADLAEWTRKDNPSHLELAYVGQQLWPDAAEMLDALGGLE
jgi:hypothetical protein